jgi:hypothetical protein
MHTSESRAVSWIGNLTEILSLIAWISLFVVSVGTSLAQVSVLTQHNDNFRSGDNLNETILNTSNVNVSQFGKLFSRRVDGQIYAQPLYVPSVTIPNQGVHNVVYVATEHNSVYAFDADDSAASVPLWHVNLGPSVYYLQVSSDTNFRPELGITSTPVIDPTKRMMYVVAYTSENTDVRYRLHALDITTGQEKLGGPMLIQGSVPGTAVDSVSGVLAFNPAKHLQRPALLLQNGIIYIAYSSHADIAVYHGWVFAYSAANLQQVAVYNTSPSGQQAGIWQSGQGPAVDAQGSIYYLTGNGTSTRDGVNIGSSFGKFGLTGSTLSLLDWFTPSNIDALNAADTDLGSGGVLAIPGTNLVVGGGKEGVIFLLNETRLGHFGNPLESIHSCYNGHLHGSPVYWNSPTTGQRIYFWCEMDYLKSYQLVNGLLNQTAADVSLVHAGMGMPGGFLSISSNGTTEGSGIIWASMPYTADSVHQTVAGELRAFDVTDLATELWNSKEDDNRDDVGDFGKFNPPTIVNGKVYLGTFSGQLIVYGLLPSTSTHTDGYAVASGGSAQGSFLGDRYFSGGTVAQSDLTPSSYVDPKAVAYPAPQMVYRAARQGIFTYTLSSLTKGHCYAVRLHFNDFQSTTAGQRMFNVAINKMPVLANFDIYATAGGKNLAIDKVFLAIADTTGTITVQFSNGSAGAAQSNGIEITPIGTNKAAFADLDSITQKNWVGTYGGDGYNVIGDQSNYPTYAQVSVSGASLTSLSPLQPVLSANTNMTVDVNITDGVSHRVALYFLDGDTSNLRAQSVEVLDAANGTVIDSQTILHFLSGQYAAWNVTGHVQFRIASMNANTAVLSAIFFDQEKAIPQAGATFLRVDAHTRGSWKGVYGASGYNVINDSTSYPAYAEVNFSGGAPFTWSNPSVDMRALQQVESLTDRIAACWFSDSKFSVDINLTDSQTHSVAFYFLDEDNKMRGERIEVIDAATKVVLSKWNVSSFVGGEYLVWNLSGHVQVQITHTAGDNAVLSGIFFDNGYTGNQALLAATDATTQGNWKGIYGTGGYNVINDSVSYPAYAQVSLTGGSPFTWAPSPTDGRALQKGTSTGRIAACLYSAMVMTVDIRLTDGNTHQIALYFLDWDTDARVEQIDIVDATSGVVLSTEQVSAFSGGVYLVWNLAGHVLVRITNLGPDNATLSGIFFDNALPLAARQAPFVDGLRARSASEVNTPRVITSRWIWPNEFAEVLKSSMMTG